MKKLLLPLLTILMFPLYTFAKLPDPASLTWHAITFGQSTDLNFGSTILPNKIGLNQVSVEGEKILSGPLEKNFTIESRGGKLANSHEGVTYYYTTLPTDVNFTLSATIELEQLGPETDASPNHQEGAGIMIRDIIGKPRMDPQPAGMEEFPAASNMVMNALRANEKGNKNGLINIYGIYREGIYHPWGTGGNQIYRDAYLSALKYGAAIKYEMSVTRTDAGFEMTFKNNESTKKITLDGANANIVEMQDPENQYIGFFASRNAKINVSDVNLTLSPAKTQNTPKYQATLNPLVIELASPKYTATDDYIIQVRANYSGTFSIAQDDKTLVSNQAVAAGEFFDYPTRITNDSSSFIISYTAEEGPDLQTKIQNLDVEKIAINNPMAIYVQPNASSRANGSQQNPTNIQTAIKAIAPGGIIFLMDGQYPELTIPVSESGVKDKIKSLVALNDNVTFIGSVLHQAHYWHYKNIEVTKGQFTVSGSHNTFEKMLTHDAPDTGFQITSPSGIGRTLWASYNTVIDSESYNNMDESRINADGFAAKMRVGDGNTFINCLSHHNADDGWDLFNKVEDGPNGVVTILNSIAFRNGQTLKHENKGGTIGNGFKLGGEGLPVAHVIKNSLAFANNMDGFTDNFNPGSLVVENNIAIDNKRFNYLFRLSPYSKEVKQGTFIKNVSLRFHQASTYDDVVHGEKLIDNAFYQNKQTLFSPKNQLSDEQRKQLERYSQIDESQEMPGRKEALQLKAALFD